MVSVPVEDYKGRRLVTTQAFALDLRCTLNQGVHLRNGPADTVEHKVLGPMRSQE